MQDTGTSDGEQNALIQKHFGKADADTTLLPGKPYSSTTIYRFDLAEM